MLTEVEHRKRLVEWNNTIADYPCDRCVHELFEEQAERTPDAVAVEFADRRFTYAQLNARANQLAHFLRSRGVGPDVLVGLHLHRSIEMVLGILAVLKAGGAYVPFDPSYPPERLAFMLEDAQAPLLLTHTSLQPSLPPTSVSALAIEEAEETARSQPEYNPSPLVSGEHLAYMIYTSGSTGQPKGALNTHRGIRNRLLWMQEEYALDSSDRVLQKTPFSFDVSVWEFLWPLLSGACLVVARPEGHKDPVYLVELIRSRGITTLHFVPSMLGVFLQAPGVEGCLSVRRVICSGEALPLDLTQRFFSRLGGVELHNLYGPTEAAVDVTYYACLSEEAGSSVPIGRPIANTQIHLLDRFGGLVPEGVAGELYIGGVNVGRGYHNRAELTAQKFVPDPFSIEPGSRMYRTGDLCRYLPDGNIEFVGRIDHQVKIRGFRIELGEIESVLRRHGGVREAVVLAREDVPGDKRLVAYVVSQGGGMSSGALREHLRQTLPEYMVPSAFVTLDALPLTPNGKIDRRALPPLSITRPDVGVPYVAPGTPQEEAMAAHWSQVLQIEPVGIHDNFFELGGHSLSGAQILSRVRATFQVELPLQALFESPTIAQLAARLDGERSVTAPPLAPVDRDRPLPLSFVQEGLWFLDRLAPDQPFYCIPLLTHWIGPLDGAALQSGLDALVFRHETLRTTFALHEDAPVQTIHPPHRVPLALIDLTNLSQTQQQAAIEQTLTAETARPLDLTRGPLLRGLLLCLAQQEHLLLLMVHHIVADGWSLQILQRDLHALYLAALSGQPSTLSELAIQYADYAVWQREWLRGEVLETQIAYWRRQLAHLPTLDLPTDHPRPALPSYRGATHTGGLSLDLLIRLKSLSRQEGVTVFMSLLAAFNVLLARYSGHEDIVVGSPIAGRVRSELEPLIGMLANTLVLRTDVSGEPTFRELLVRVRQVALDAYANQDVAFEKLVEALRPPRDPSLNPLFQVMLVLENAPHRTLELPGVTIREEFLCTQTSKFDLLLSLTENERGLACSWEYSTDLFEASTIERMHGHLETLLESIAAGPDQRLSHLSMLTEVERQELLIDWNDNEANYPRDRCVHELFEEQAERMPDKVAVEFEDHCLTYAQLNAHANRLANRLTQHGVGPEAYVGLCAQRSLEMIVALLAILKAGAAYLPIDPSYPPERVAFMCRDAGVRVVLTYGDIHDALREANVPCLPLQESLTLSVAPHPARVADPPLQEAPSVHTDNRATGVVPQCAAYLIYTSGSTGRPKGVVMSHGALVNLLCWQREVLPTPARTLQFTSLGFDVSFQEIFSTWLGAGTLVLVSEEQRRDFSGLLGLMDSWRIERLFVPFAVLQHLAVVRAAGGMLPRGLREVITAGEALQITGEIAAWFGSEGGPRLYNQYGPTEAHVVSANSLEGPVSEWALLPPIGRAISNTRLYVLDAKLSPTPVGVPGDLYIGGVCLSRGYLNRTDLTAERFVPDPLSVEPGPRMYRTGDLCRYLKDGNIEFVGRVDHQVKIRGFRIELGEIESVLLSHPGVRETVVLAREDKPGDKQLVAYVVSRDGGISAGELREHLRQALPEYMVPVAFVMLDALPLTPNGKVDHRALPAPPIGRPEGEIGYAEARTEVEAMLVGLWSRVLGLNRVGIHDNFFDLGGHSLSGAVLIARIRHVFGCELSLPALFEAPTIAQLGQRLLCATETTALTLVPVSRDQSLPLSFAQEGLWFLDRLAPGLALYTIPVLVRLTGSLGVAALQATLDELVRRHEAMRTTFELQGAHPVQTIHPPERVPLSLTDLTALSISEQGLCLKQALTAEAERAFDLAVGPLFRAHLWRLSAREHRLLLTVHHAVADGWSMQVLQREVSALYRAFTSGDASPLPPLSLQYADYAVWQRQWLHGESLEARLAYWRKQLAGLPTLELPTDRPRPGIQTFRGTVHTGLLTSSLVAGLKDLSRREGVTLFMSLLAGFNALLARYSGGKDIAVGSPITERMHADLEPLIGMFVNSMVLRTDLSGEPTFQELLGRVRQVALDAYAHHEVPFEQLVQALNPERDGSRHPLFQVMLAMETPAEDWQLAGLAVQEEAVSTGTSKLDLLLSLAENEWGLACYWEYNTDLFDACTIKRLHGHFQTLLEGIVADPQTRISLLPVLTEPERHQLLYEWNDTAADYPRDRCVHELFEEQVQRAPDAVALVFEEEQLTYSELNRRANQLAHYLQSLGVGPEVLVGLCVERSIEMIVAMLAILKAGGAYLPLDPTYPIERLAFMLEDARAPLLLTQHTLAQLLPAQSSPLLCLDTHAHLWHSQPTSNLALPLHPLQLAYLIYTSGSTGVPNAVMATHRGLSNYLHWALQTYPLQQGCGSAVHSSPSFDLTLTSLLLPLLSGTSVTLVAHEPGVQGLCALLRRCPMFSVLKLTPSHLKLLSEALTPQEAAGSAHSLVIGGEALLGSSLDVWREHAPETQVFNEYGPTETVVGCCVYRVRAGEVGGGGVPIGVPIGNTQAYVVDAFQAPVCVGVVGELYIGGSGVARGYLNRAELTAEKFLPDPFSGEFGSRMYRTGDQVRWVSDGNLEFVGRADDQVKIRGYRIELGEIENALLSHPSVRDAVVLAREDVPGEKRLVAYITAHPHSVPDATALRAYLQETLPEYMLPAAFVMLDALPLTPNGKVDRKALPQPDAHPMTHREELRRPVTPAEAALVPLWEELLNTRPIDVRDNFFELGGHSLLAVRLFARIEHQFGKRLPLATLFQRPTPREIAALLEDEPMQVSWRCLVPIKPEGERAPFFCAHPLGGNLLHFRFLAHSLAADQPFYGIQSHGLDAEEWTPSTVEEMAAHYIEEICSFQPTGPYYLGGVSGGGSIVYEMARQLVAKGERVALLALIDTYLVHPGLHAETAQRFQHPLMRQLLWLDGVLGNLLFDQRSKAGSYLVERLRVRLDTLWARLRGQPLIASERELPESFRRVRAAIRLALGSYRAGPYAGRVTQFLVRETRLRTGMDPRLPAGDLAAGGLEVHFVDGDHITMLNEPHVRVLASRLQGCLDRAAVVERLRAEERVAL